MTDSDRTAVIVSAARLPTGRFLGGLASLPAPQLGAKAIAAAVERAALDSGEIEDVIMGNVVQAGVGQAPARQAAIHSGLPATIPALTINKVCGSGLKAVMLAAQAIRAGDARVIVAGGMESMSNVPYYVRGLRNGVKFGDQKMVDGLIHDGLWCSFGECHMGGHAEYTAQKASISRSDADAYASIRTRRQSPPSTRGNSGCEIVPVEIETRKGREVIDTGRVTSRDTSLEALASCARRSCATRRRHRPSRGDGRQRARTQRRGQPRSSWHAEEYAQPHGLEYDPRSISGLCLGGHRAARPVLRAHRGRAAADGQGREGDRGLRADRGERGVRGAGDRGRAGARDGRSESTSNGGASRSDTRSVRRARGSSRRS
jgi:acetyl-CoA C-acetyltransferase